MSLLRGRSRSESRHLDQREKRSSLQAVQMQVREAQLAIVRLSNENPNPNGNVNAYEPHGMGRRKTSAELISEAKTQLDVVDASQLRGGGNYAATKYANKITHSKSSCRIAEVGGGLRLVSTHRPITPRESGRALYGNVVLAGRPPSAFSLRYLQNEKNRPTPLTPALEPIRSGVGGSTSTPTNGSEIHGAFSAGSNQHLCKQRMSRRSNSLDARIEFYIGGASSCGVVQSKAAHHHKLPALAGKGVPADAQRGNNTAVDSATEVTPERFPTARAEPLDNGASTDEALAVDLVTSRKLLTRHFDLLAQSTTERLVELLKEHAGLKECTDETVSHINAILVQLYHRVRKHEKSFKRGFILGGLYGLVECSSPKILLAVARVVLALRVTGSNLTGACKLIFKVARNEQNDHLFHDNDLLELLIDGLGRASPLDDPEACIYGYGSIRFLTCSTGQERADATTTKDVNRNWSDCLELPRKPATAPAPGDNNKSSPVAAFAQLQQECLLKLSRQNSLVERLARHGAVELMVLHLQILNETGATKRLSGPPLHSLYQLSAALRALSDVRQTSCSMDQDLDADKQRSSSVGNIQLELACPHLIRAAEVSIGELEVQANVVRTLSMLSEDSDCCLALSNFSARIGMLLGPCCEMFGNGSEKLLSLFSRLGYILGNIMAKHDAARIQFYHNDVAMEYLINVLELYARQPLGMQNAQGDTVIDVLVKLIRVVANMSVNAEVGFGLGSTRALGALMLTLLNAAQHQASAIKLTKELKELMHATLGALHNLCFYQDQNATPAQVVEAKGSLQSVLPDLATALGGALRSAKQPSMQVEAARVLGNLTRNELARKYFCRSDGMALIVQHLSARPVNSALQTEDDLKACAIGVLVNLLGDWENRGPFVQLQGGELLAALLKEALQRGDWFAATIVCQAIWNLLIDTAGMVDGLCQEQLLDDVADLLADHLDEERLFDGSVVGDGGGGADALWEDFAIVATDLLERIQSSYDKQSESTVSLETPSDNDDNCGTREADDEDDVYIEEM